MKCFSRCLRNPRQPWRRTAARTSDVLPEPGSWQAILKSDLDQCTQGKTSLLLQVTHDHGLVPHEELTGMNISPESIRKLQCIVEIGLDVTGALRSRHEKGEPQINHEVVSQNREDVASVVKCVLSLSRSRFPALKTVYLIWPEEYWKHPGATMVEYVNAGMQEAHSMDTSRGLVVQLMLSSWERVVVTQSRRLGEPQRSGSTSSGTVQSRRNQFGQCRRRA